MMEIINLNEFLTKEFKSCFVCGNINYCEFYIKEHLFRICAKCLKTEPVKNFLRMSENIE